MEFVKLLTPESLKRVQNIADEIWPWTYAEILSPEQIGYMMNMMYSTEVLEKELAEGYCFDLCVIDGEDAGFLSFSPYEEEGTAKLHKVYLRQKFHGKGNGQLMLKHACERCRELGYHSVLLAVNKHNLRAQKAYKRAGFTMEKAVCVDVGQGFVMDDYLMRKSL